MFPFLLVVHRNNLILDNAQEYTEFIKTFKNEEKSRPETDLLRTSIIHFTSGHWQVIKSDPLHTTPLCCQGRRGERRASKPVFFLVKNSTASKTRVMWLYALCIQCSYPKNGPFVSALSDFKTFLVIYTAGLWDKPEQDKAIRIQHPNTHLSFSWGNGGLRVIWFNECEK